MIAISFEVRNTYFSFMALTVLNLKWTFYFATILLILRVTTSGTNIADNIFCVATGCLVGAGRDELLLFSPFLSWD